MQAIFGNGLLVARIDFSYQQSESYSATVFSVVRIDFGYQQCESSDESRER